MNLITDRTRSDVLLNTEKGRYEAADLNRVEDAVGNLCLIARTKVPLALLTTKTDWGAPGLFSVSSWNAASQMDRYLTNVKRLCEVTGVQAELPESMRFLTTEGANQIEKALLLVQEHLSKNQENFQYSGEIYAGEENGL
ncbi:MAG: hypothetical protein IJ403_01570 [Oscillospiraceae bacterium]|nr:hypothetical protein [Oscillospiraceae bacterium]